jgi:hypothetical protein
VQWRARVLATCQPYLPNQSQPKGGQPWPVPARPNSTHPKPSPMNSFASSNVVFSHGANTLAGGRSNGVAAISGIVVGGMAHIRRFLIHVLPPSRACKHALPAMDGFHRIRHYGLLASGVRKTRLARIRAMLCVQPPDQADIQDTEPDVTPLTLREPCPCCGGPMQIIEIFRRGPKPMSRAPPSEQAA